MKNKYNQIDIALSILKVLLLNLGKCEEIGVKQLSEKNPYFSVFISNLLDRVPLHLVTPECLEAA